MLYRANLWYDRLDRTHPILRFWLALTLMLPLCGATYILDHYGKGPTLAIIAWTGFLMVSRVLYFNRRAREC